jgi:hypothetical protein
MSLSRRAMLASGEFADFFLQGSLGGSEVPTFSGKEIHTLHSAQPKSNVSATRLPTASAGIPPGGEQRKALPCRRKQKDIHLLSGRASFFF